MLFCSEVFIFIFLPVFLIVYYLTPAKGKNMVLLLGSLYFYISGEPRWFWLILVSVLLHFLLTNLMCKKSKSTRKLLLVILLLYDFGGLFFFKYMPFVLEQLNGLIGWLNKESALALKILPPMTQTLPLGISFYTFQIAAYAIDVYRRPSEYEKNLINLGAYVCMFPQLIAGPIVLLQDVRAQLHQRRVKMMGVEQGLKLFAIGLGYKMLIANVLGSLWHEIQVVGVESISSSMAWMGAIAFSLQLYFDFNGYSLMAMGLGEMLGFRFPRNFKHPYTAYSITDFWRKWHVTLSTWFREYVYIPLGGNKKGGLRTIFNLFIVWVLTGLWHGAGWNFLLWGIYYFLLLTLEKFLLGRFFERHHGIGRIYTMIAVVTGWVIFALEDLGSIGIYLQKMFFWLFQPGAWTMNMHVTLDALKRYGLFFAAAILLSSYLPENIYKKYKNRIWFVLLLLFVFWRSVYQILSGADNPFLYFRF